MPHAGASQSQNSPQSPAEQISQYHRSLSQYLLSLTEGLTHQEAAAVCAFLAQLTLSDPAFEPVYIPGCHRQAAPQLQILDYGSFTTYSVTGFKEYLRASEQKRKFVTRGGMFIEALERQSQEAKDRLQHEALLHRGQSGRIVLTTRPTTTVNSGSNVDKFRAGSAENILDGRCPTKLDVPSSLYQNS